MKEEHRKKKLDTCTVINLIAAIIFFILIMLSITLLKDPLENKLICRVLARGIFGLLVLYNAGYLLFTKGTAFIWHRMNEKQRLIGGIAIGIIGLILVVTAILGYGVNGDPVLTWWK